MTTEKVPQRARDENAQLFLFRWRDALRTDCPRCKKPPKISATAYPVLLELSTYANTDDGTQCRPGHERLAKAVRRTERHVSRGIREGIERGWITLVRPGYGNRHGLRSAALYTLTIPSRTCQECPPLDLEPDIDDLEQDNRDVRTGQPCPPISQELTKNSQLASDAREGESKNVLEGQDQGREHREELSDAIADACRSPLAGATSRGKAQHNTAVVEILPVWDGTRKQVLRKAENYRRSFPNANLTPLALSKWWALDDTDSGEWFDQPHSPDPVPDDCAEPDAHSRWHYEGGRPYGSPDAAEVCAS